MAIEIIIDVLGGFVVLFLPGFFLSIVFFAWGKIRMLERIILSVGLSIAVTPIGVFYSNIVGIPITPLSVITESTCIAFLSLILIRLKQKRRI